MSKNTDPWRKNQGRDTPTTQVIRNRDQMQALYGIGGEERQQVIDWIAELDVPAPVAKTLAKLTDLDLVVEAFCDHCDKPVKVRYPDYKGMTGIYKLIFDYKLQRPSELRQVDVNVRVKRMRDELEALSDEELLSISEGEWKALPSRTPSA